MRTFLRNNNSNCVCAFFAVKELIIPAIINAVIITEAVTE